MVCGTRCYGPVNVKITAEFNDDMTGGVHNVFIYDNHVYAVNNGRKYDIINIEDPYNPFRVGRYELDTPGHGVHDVWVEDGIAYSSNWADGVPAVDVGGVKFNEKNRSKMKYNPFLAMAGQGSPGNPVKLGGMADPNGHNHAAFPSSVNQLKNSILLQVMNGETNLVWLVVSIFLISLIQKILRKLLYIKSLKRFT
ncbi:MAG: hypothetical protein Ct9H300mP18_12910 [Candidatus Neomarinimicrobiota bacterium]|nr:MAG: hypothetical protein Ct9H300mP18_12910 [Candidatus Neomarinimicrobiota bacterium]